MTLLVYIFVSKTWLYIEEGDEVCLVYGLWAFL